MKKAKIGAHSVPVVDGVSAADFSAGAHGTQERGIYHFWTAVCLEKGKQANVTGRALKQLDPGERFRRIDNERKTSKLAADRKAYARLWKRLQTPLYVRPATPVEVAHWLMTHQSDAPFLKSLRFK